MRTTAPEKKALLALLEWAIEYHAEEINRWIDQGTGEDWCGGNNLQSVRDKLRAEVRLTDDEKLERDNAAHDFERDKREHY